MKDMENFKVRGEISEFIPFAALRDLRLPLFETPIQCGFPSPAEDYRHFIDLNEELIMNPEATFLGRADSNSMEPTVCEGELLIIDCAVEVRNGCLVLAEIDGEFCMKEFHRTATQIVLTSHNEAYEPIIINSEMTVDFRLRGRIIHAIKSFCK